MSERDAPVLDAEAVRAAVEWAIRTRRSVRGFRPTPIPRETVERILTLASRAPSGSNMQPWKVHVLLGPALERLRAELLALHEAGAPEAREYDYYPREWRQPYLDRRRRLGWGLYALAGVEKGDRVGAARQRGRNYVLFGAPVGMIFTIDRDLGRGSWLDFGMFLQNIMIAARGHGLDTCPQAALANYPDVVRRQLGIPEDELVLCGMALGFEDSGEPVNRLAVEREPLGAFTIFHET
ncbi:nitroreductase [Arenibaculum pallidiluteum]|uniref:nitroreductase n=1 Tax=Arenibaculum pallidiluteum TaxID=2812559 RepID=UPI001A97C32A|nr:nitroreductase [Arenibaculum pallidiluteum]